MVKTATQNTNTKLKTLKQTYATYSAPSQTDIPVELVEHYDDTGFILKWIRHIDPKTEGVDLKNLSKKRRYGWEPVTHKELESLNMPGVADMFEIGSDPKQKGWIIVGDLSLWKRPIEESEQQAAYVEEESWRQINDLRRAFGDLRKDGIKVDNYKTSFNRRSQPKFGNGETTEIEVDQE